MNNSRIASRYARALYTLVKEQGKIEPVRDNLAGLVELLNESAEFRTLLESPVLQGSEKSKIVIALLSGRVDPVTLDFLNMLIDHKRELYLASIYRMFQHMYKAEQGVLEAEVESAVPMDDTLLADLKSRLEKSTGSSIDFKTTVNDELIGGFKLTLEDQQLDASVLTQLRKIKQELRESKN
ncbi:MAG: ATP synthase F1 subunit delta [Bacteroidota bacterium]